jgi:hypothetical protein
MMAETGLKWLLRFIAVTTLMAFLSAVMPQAWLSYLIDKSAPGAPAGILITYMARMLSILYVFVGLQCFIFSFDITRYRPIIWLIGAGSIVVTVIGIIFLFFAFGQESRTVVFWIIFVDLAGGFVQGVLIVILLLRIPCVKPRD